MYCPVLDSISSNLVQEKSTLDTLDTLGMVWARTGTMTNFPPHGAWKATVKHKIGLAKAYAIRHISHLAWKNDFNISRRTFALKVDHWTTSIWRSEWQSQIGQNYKQTGIWYPQGHKPEIARAIFTLDRDSIGKLIQLFSGHGWLRYAQHKRGGKTICCLQVVQQWGGNTMALVEYLSRYITNTSTVWNPQHPLVFG